MHGSSSLGELMASYYFLTRDLVRWSNKTGECFREVSLSYGLGANIFSPVYSTLLAYSFSEKFCVVALAVLRFCVSVSNVF